MEDFPNLAQIFTPGLPPWVSCKKVDGFNTNSVGCEKSQTYMNATT